MRPTTARRVGRVRKGLLAFAACGLLTALATGAPAAAHEADGHPARVHQGTCQQLGPVAFTLTGVGAAVDPAGAAVATPVPVNAERGFEITLSETTLDAPLETLLLGEDLAPVSASGASGPSDEEASSDASHDDSTDDAGHAAATPAES